MTGDRQPTTADHSQISVTISIAELYKTLCPDCQARLLDYIASKAGAGAVRDGLRRQLEAPRHSERSEESPHVDR